MTRLQVKASAIGKILSSLEKKYDANSLHEMQPDAEFMKKSTSANLGHSKQRPHIKVSIQSIPPFNANKIRNSPSVETIQKPFKQEKFENSKKNAEILLKPDSDGIERTNENNQINNQIIEILENLEVEADVAEPKDSCSKDDSKIQSPSTKE